MDKVPNEWIRQLCGVTKGLDENTEESVLRWFGHGERIENEKISMVVYVEECAR